MLTKASPYLLYPVAVFVVLRLVYAYSKNPDSPAKDNEELSWLLTLAFVAAAGLGVLCMPIVLNQHWWCSRRDPVAFILAAVSVLSGVACAGLAGRHLRLGRTYRSTASFAGVGLGAFGFVFMAQITVIGSLYTVP